MVMSGQDLTIEEDALRHRSFLPLIPQSGAVISGEEHHLLTPPPAAARVFHDYLTLVLHPLMENSCEHHKKVLILGCHQPGLDVNPALYPACHHRVVFCPGVKQWVLLVGDFFRKEFLSVLQI